MRVYMLYQNTMTANMKSVFCFLKRPIRQQQQRKNFEAYTKVE